MGKSTAKDEGVTIVFQKSPDSQDPLLKEISEVLNEASSILDQVSRYEGCEDLIRKAITNPSPETEEAAWQAVKPAVDQLYVFHAYSEKLTILFPKILQELCKNEPKVTVTENPALTTYFLEVFDFVIRWDDAKMINPAIQNDFAYYRRTLNRLKLHNKQQVQEAKIKDELANRMSLFFAYPAPMMKAINECTIKALSKADFNVPKENVSALLSLVANSIAKGVQNKQFENPQQCDIALTAMTGCIILFDHLTTKGAFHKASPVAIKDCVQVLKDSAKESLQNALRFQTLHLADAETPAKIKALLN